MALAPLFALVLLAQAADGPMLTGPASEGRISKELEDAASAPRADPTPSPVPQPGRPMTTRSGVALPSLTTDTPKLDRAAAEKEPYPPGAPEDDYGFVAWCYGALQGHMALFEKVRPQLDALPDPNPSATAAADREMMRAGGQYLELYARALRAAEKGDPDVVKAPAPTLIARGRSIWDKAEAADPKTRMWSWTMWTLPGKCELAAERLYEKSNLAGGARMRSSPVRPR